MSNGVTDSGIRISSGAAISGLRFVRAGYGRPRTLLGVDVLRRLLQVAEHVALCWNRDFRTLLSRLPVLAALRQPLFHGHLLVRVAPRRYHFAPDREKAPEGASALLRSRRIDGDGSHSVPRIGARNTEASLLSG